MTIWLRHYLADIKCYCVRLSSIVFDTSSAQSDVSFERLISILKMALIRSFDRSENISGSQNKAPKTIEVRTDICQNYRIISSFYH